MKKLVIVALALFTAMTATAEWYGVFRGGVELGGAQVIPTTYFTLLGETEYTPIGYHEVRGGGLWSIGIGAGFSLGDNLVLEGTVGYKLDAATSAAGAVDGEGERAPRFDAQFKRIPVELGLYIPLNKKVRAGGGVSYHIDPRLSIVNQDISEVIVEDPVSGATETVTNVTESRGNLSYDDELGFYAEVAYKATEHTYLGLRYTVIEYSGASNNGLDISGNNDIDGNSVGINFLYQF